MPPVNRNQPIRAESSESRYSLMEFMHEFPDDATCLEWLWRNRYSPDGVHADCPKCGVNRAFKRYQTKQQRQSWTCTACGEHLHPTAGTIFHKSSTSLHLWFYAMYLMTSTRCGISAKQLERELGVTYKTAWRIAHEIRHVLMEQDGARLSGAVEADETYIGGYKRGAIHRGRRNNLTSNKTPVVGVVQRGGKVATSIARDASGTTLIPFIREKVMPSSVVYTDEWRGYNALNRTGYRHKRINHSEKVYVSGDIHTNTVEGFWSIVKRGISGTYHAVSAKHLQGYLNEYAWRYNHRKDGRAQFETLLLRGTRPS